MHHRCLERNRIARHRQGIVDIIPTCMDVREGRHDDVIAATGFRLENNPVRARVHVK